MTNEQLEQDIIFLATRQRNAGKVTFIGKRDTGMSSNSIISIAYGIESLDEQRFPRDASDMQSCENMWENIPEHRKTGNGLKAMEAARKCNYYGKKP